MSVAWVAVGATVLNGVVQNRASNKAVDAQTDSAREANATALTTQRESIAFQQKQADQARKDSEPWRLAGTNALARLTQRTGPNGDLIRNFGMNDFQADPGYQFRMDEGMKGLTNSAAARGGLLSGAALKAASTYNQNMASNEYGNSFNRFNMNRDAQYNKLASLAGIGQTVANQNGNNAMQLGQSVGAGMINTGQQIGQNMMGAGNARASGYLAQGNALQGAVNAGVSAWNQVNNQPSYDKWANSNTGVMRSTGLSASDLGTF